MRVSVNVLHGNSNAEALCRAFAKGISACGDTAVVRTARDHNMSGFDAALFWGFVTECQDLKAACEASGIPWVFMDNGYQLRHTHFKVTLNDRHPEAYIMKHSMPDDRFKRWDISIQAWRASLPSAPIILAGMSPKAAWSWGFAFEEWERTTVGKLQKNTMRPIIYRPKRNSPGAKPIPGTTMDGRTPIHLLLRGAHAVVTHHSNVGCDALYAGVPVFTRFGAALPLAVHIDSLDLIGSPTFPEDRQQWAHNLAYCQWNAAEMASGACWTHMKGLMV